MIDWLVRCAFLYVAMGVVLGGAMWTWTVVAFPELIPERLTLRMIARTVLLWPWWLAAVLRAW